VLNGDPEPHFKGLLIESFLNGVADHRAGAIEKKTAVERSVTRIVRDIERMRLFISRSLCKGRRFDLPATMSHDRPTQIRDSTTEITEQDGQQYSVRVSHSIGGYYPRSMKSADLKLQRRRIEPLKTI
jgi:hypothetical protein